MAARAHDVVARALRGRSACLNFADSAWRLPVPASANREDIQKAAAEAFRPQEEAEAVAAVESQENVFSSMDNYNNIETTKETTENVFYVEWVRIANPWLGLHTADPVSPCAAQPLAASPLAIPDVTAAVGFATGDENF
ncbi:hypothetical protein BUALT_Bualt03G0193800 [Buddleja alternifolia]|uniref:Uncharacterized protein n=1 Tax=Buddleja alternifolia TaxID=168488 RepID=A0AAV6Y2D1_9LAMI|nr:hypothetical protein BUALT_Bualt03G0193800 [Buddleja alternifolia]